MARFLIAMFMIGFVAVTWRQSRLPDPGEAQSPGHPYLWNLNWYDLQPDALERTHGHVDLPPIYKQVYGPVNVRTANGGWREEWGWITVRIQ